LYALPSKLTINDDYYCLSVEMEFNMSTMASLCSRMFFRWINILGCLMIKNRCLPHREVNYIEDCTIQWQVLWINEIWYEKAHAVLCGQQIDNLV